MNSPFEADLLPALQKAVQLRIDLFAAISEIEGIVGRDSDGLEDFLNGLGSTHDSGSEITLDDVHSLLEYFPEEEDEDEDDEPEEKGEEEEAGDDLCDVCMSAGVNANRTTPCGKTIGIECGCDHDRPDGLCGDSDCLPCRAAENDEDGDDDEAPAS